MPDNKNIKHPLDGQRIDINDPQEVRDWCDTLACTEEKLKSAVEKVGTSAKEVKEFLRKDLKRSLKQEVEDFLKLE